MRNLKLIKNYVKSHNYYIYSTINFSFISFQNEKHNQTMDRNCVITMCCCCIGSRSKIRSDYAYAISFSASWCSSWVSHLSTSRIRWRIRLSVDIWTRWYGMKKKETNHLQWKSHHFVLVAFIWKIVFFSPIRWCVIIDGSNRKFRMYEI